MFQTNKMKKLSIKNQGVTLLELMIAITVLGIITVIALPSYQGYIERGYQSQAHVELLNINNNIKTMQVKNPSQSHDEFETELTKLVNGYTGDSKVKEKYNYAVTLEENNRRYRLTATPTNSSGYKLSVWMDNMGNAYKCQTPEAANNFDEQGNCKAISNKKKK